ncbi:MAG: hypothetical protein HQM14_15370 [SAR324 cluster bacterium]|nr:hypothetical protein [SAR324 cluster bacterium]
MKNDYRFGETHIAIPPTVLFTAIGKIEDIRKTITMDAKHPGDLVYLLGDTKNELGGSEYYDHLGYLGCNVPQVEAKSAKERYDKLSEAITSNWVRSCHDCSDGGLAVALAETAFAGGFGMMLDISAALAKNPLRTDTFLFSESQSRFVVTIDPQHRHVFENLFAAQSCYYLGEIVKTTDFTITQDNTEIIHSSVIALKESWQATLR